MNDRRNPSLTIVAPPIPKGTRCHAMGCDRQATQSVLDNTSRSAGVLSLRTRFWCDGDAPRTPRAHA